MNGKILMTLTCFIWAMNFTLTKIGLDSFSAYNFVFYRFFIGAVFLTIIFRKHLKNMNAKIIKDGIFLGILFFIGNLATTMSLEQIAAAETNTYMALEIPMIPLFAYMFIKEKLSMKNIFCAALAAAGIIVFNYSGTVSLSMGAIFAIVAAAGYAMHIVFTEKFVKSDDGIVLIIIQAYLISIFSGILSFTGGEGLKFDASVNSIVALLLAAILVNVVSYLLQIQAQKKISASETGIIISLLPVFGLFIAMIVLGDRLTFNGAIGTFMILLSVFISNMSFNFHRKHIKQY